MSSIADVAIAAATGMPRFEEGFINLQEVLRQLAESVVKDNGIEVRFKAGISVDVES